MICIQYKGKGRSFQRERGVIRRLKDAIYFFWRRNLGGERRFFGQVFEKNPTLSFLVRRLMSEQLQDLFAVNYLTRNGEVSFWCCCGFGFGFSRFGRRCLVRSAFGFFLAAALFISGFGSQIDLEWR